MRRIHLGAALLLALTLAGCLGDGAPRTSATDDTKPRDTCQHTSEGGEARTVCY